ncbi:MAG: PPOX class F420-dependent oxidoreductase [Aquihabitans sp.]
MTDIRDARYVSLTSFKRDGSPVPVPVWLAPLPDGRAGFTTDAGSFKVKRIRRNPAVELRPCDVRGRVADGAEVVTGTASIEADNADHDLVHRAIADKYGLQFHLIVLGGKVKRLVRKGDPVVAVVITLT